MIPAAQPDGLNTNVDIDQPADSSNIALKNPEAIPVQLDISVAGLLANVPLTKEKMDVSNTKVSTSLFQLGKNYQNLLRRLRCCG